MPRNRRHPVILRLPRPALRGRLLVVALLAVLAAVAVGGAAFAGRSCGTRCDGKVWRSASSSFSSGSTFKIRWSSTAPVATSADTTAPSVPANQRISSVTTGSLTMAWTASTDNVGVAGYEAWLNDKLVGKTASTSFTYTGLACGTTYTVGLVAYDAAGNRSDRAFASGPGTTAACTAPAAVTAPASTADTVAPSAPTGLAVSGATATGLTLGWQAATDNVGVTGYAVYLNGAKQKTTSTTSWTVSSLQCGTTSTLGVAALDAAGNSSPVSTVSGATAACAPAPAPSTTPTTGTVVELNGSVTPSIFWTAVAGVGGGAITVKPAAGTSSYTVTGALDVSRAGLRIIGAAVQGTVQFLPGANGSSFENGSARSFNIFGADDVSVVGSTFDGGGKVAQNFIWDQPAGATPDRFKIVGNTIKNFYGATPDIHSEGLYVGYSTDGRIENNVFTNNGNTSHIFFTWWGSKADASSSYPRNICVRGNTFNQSHGAYFAVNIRDEIPSSTGIDVEAPPSNSVASGLGFSSSNAIVRAC